jgi:hypothetical protein
MKFSAAVIVAVIASCTVDAFAPVVGTTNKPGNVVLSMSTETPTKPYTFTKSEEIFAEAQTVSPLYRSFNVRVLFLQFVHIHMCLH